MANVVGRSTLDRQGRLVIPARVRAAAGLSPGSPLGVRASHGRDDHTPALRLLGLSLGDRACLGLAIGLTAVALTAEQAWSRLALEGLMVELIR